MGGQERDPAVGGYDWKRVAIPLALYKVLLILFVVASFDLLPRMFSVERYAANFVWPENEPPGIASAFKAWDGHHYLFLSERWYEKGSPSCVMYPLWPACIGAVAPLFAGHRLIAALVLANLFSLAGLVLLHFFLWGRHGRETADEALLFMLAYPGALFFSFPYSESLFLLLASLFVIFLYRREYAVAAIFAFLLPMTRAIGLLVVVPFAWHAWTEARAAGGGRRYADLAFLAAPLLGFAAYLGIMWASTGSPFEGFAMQGRFISHRALAGFVDPAGLVRSLFAVTSLHNYLGSALDRVLFLLLVASLARIWKIDRTYFWYAVVAGILPVTNGTFWGYVRFLAVVFPVFVALAQLLGRPERAIYRWVALSTLLALQIVLLLRHVNNYWAG